MTKIIKNQPLIIQKKNGNLVVKRNLQAFRALRGILKGKKAIDPIKWQRKIRAEMEINRP
ncbi:hypothetical protein A3I28_00925 [Candidatus Giovannonibacteria bacterium RIFCSPLOWO2_02_FULL_43_37]|uniref:Uncharacterized protein n=1 Tax=Candidatus Giovannonibacteria bacterium RIFCSPLOWO2_12_FULL_43_26 TaxID=1798363 RepID=A0A1F5XUZ4_9BACT|nr:MAG: hypothetical protein A2652_01145 [Candidatus Giovannonibacteria bacterium RIFCSPHIGHO2_01_FULL_43_140]OGF70070.1 MAG: hypothetical protein A3C76_02720 [Candidatus Giovannonibacteria bacterium RIFCSPHIGHO2_02_FULL_44_51]OGF72083.1 MAG: hypothetical protein A3E35_03825 [Candidatus Giovannonibacteria bacterium RIFCSPHIGHO2_12_FULL_44_22]OGF85760.1 MAG: hypothetical protein A3I28_00925 [Candidatus Giovannonibacteria bacterium RIFCSPLOWO2_02_FULL_43_37]OGF91719.1 MAG: hypothetical protein A3